MAHIIKDRVKELTTSTGTGQITLAGAVTGFSTFASSMSVSDTCSYCIDNGAGEWEIGTGTLISSTILDRTTVTASSNGGSSVNFSTGNKSVFITNPASAINTLQTQIDSLTPESGTFTPVVEGTTNAGVGTYTAQTGSYYKIGSIVHFSLTVAYTAHTGTGDIKITGLPYTCISTHSYNIACPRVDGLTFTGQLAGRVAGNTATIVLTSISSGGNSSNIAFDTLASFYISGSYIAQ